MQPADLAARQAERNFYNANPDLDPRLAPVQGPVTAPVITPTAPGAAPISPDATVNGTPLRAVTGGPMMAIGDEAPRTRAQITRDFLQANGLGQMGEAKAYTICGAQGTATCSYAAQDANGNVAHGACFINSADCGGAMAGTPAPPELRDAPREVGAIAGCDTGGGSPRCRSEVSVPGRGTDTARASGMSSSTELVRAVDTGAGRGAVTGNGTIQTAENDRVAGRSRRTSIEFGPDGRQPTVTCTDCFGGTPVVRTAQPGTDAAVAVDRFDVHDVSADAAARPSVFTGRSADGSPATLDVPSAAAKWDVRTGEGDHVAGVGATLEPVQTRGANGARLSVDCQNCTLETAEGDRAIAGPGDRLDALGRDRNGLGGHLEMNGRTPNIHTAEGVDLFCQTGCDEIRHEMPTEKGRGGTSTCSAGGAGQSCSALGAPVGPGGERDGQYASAGSGSGSAEFTVFHRNADGSGGGAIARTSGNLSGARGQDAYGNWVQTSGDGGRMGLLHAESDQYKSGQGCVAGAGGSCKGSDLGRGLRMEEAPDGWLRGMGMVETRDPGFIGPVADTPTQEDRDRGTLMHMGAQAHMRWTSEVGIPRLEQAVGAGEALSRAARERDGPAPAEEAAFRSAMDALDPMTRQRLGHNEGELAILNGIDEAIGRRGATTEDIEAQLATDPGLVARINGSDPSRPIGDADIVAAAARVRAQQARVDEAAAALAPDSQTQRALNDEFSAWQAAADRYAAGGGGNAAELNRQLADLQSRSAALHATLDAEQQQLRGFDLAAAGAAGDPGYLAGIDQADRHVRALAGALDALPPATTQQQATLRQDVGALVDLTRTNYQAATAAPRLPTSRLNDMYLPSTLKPDLAMALDSASRVTVFTQPTSSNVFTAYLASPQQEVKDQIADLRANYATPEAAAAASVHPVTANAPAERATFVAPERIAAVEAAIGGSSDVVALPMLYQDAPDAGGGVGQMTLFRVRGPDGERFVDDTGATFSSLQDFHNHNLLSRHGRLLMTSDVAQDGVAPGTRVAVPADDAIGRFDASGRLAEGAAHVNTPWQNVTEVGDKAAGPIMMAGGVAMVGAAAVGTAVSGGTALPVTSVVASTGAGLVATGAGYGAISAGERLQQRARHGQSMSFSDRGARADYLTLAGTAAAGVGGGLMRAATRQVSGLSTAAPVSMRTGAASPALVTGARQVVAPRTHRGGRMVNAAGAGVFVEQIGEQAYTAASGRVPFTGEEVGETARAEAGRAAYDGISMLALPAAAAHAGRGGRPSPAPTTRDPESIPQFLQPEAPGGAARPLTSRIDDAMSGRTTASETTLADHLGVTPAEIRGAVTGAPRGGGSRYQITHNEFSGVDYIRRTGAELPTRTADPTRTTALDATAGPTGSGPARTDAATRVRTTDDSGQHPSTSRTTSRDADDGVSATDREQAAPSDPTTTRERTGRPGTERGRLGHGAGQPGRDGPAGRDGRPIADGSAEPATPPAPAPARMTSENAPRGGGNVPRPGRSSTDSVVPGAGGTGSGPGSTGGAGPGTLTRGGSGHTGDRAPGTTRPSSASAPEQRHGNRTSGTDPPTSVEDPSVAHRVAELAEDAARGRVPDKDTAHGMAQAEDIVRRIADTNRPTPTRRPSAEAEDIRAKTTQARELVAEARRRDRTQSQWATELYNRLRSEYATATQRHPDLAAAPRTSVPSRSVARRMAQAEDIVRDIADANRPTPTRGPSTQAEEIAAKSAQARELVAEVQRRAPQEARWATEMSQRLALEHLTAANRQSATAARGAVPSREDASASRKTWRERVAAAGQRARLGVAAGAVVVASVARVAAPVALDVAPPPARVSTAAATTADALVPPIEAPARTAPDAGPAPRGAGELPGGASRTSQDPTGRSMPGTVNVDGARSASWMSPNTSDNQWVSSFLLNNWEPLRKAPRILNVWDPRLNNGKPLGMASRILKTWAGDMTMLSPHTIEVRVVTSPAPNGIVMQESRPAAESELRWRLMPPVARDLAWKAHDEAQQRALEATRALAELDEAARARSRYADDMDREAARLRSENVVLLLPPQRREKGRNPDISRRTEAAQVRQQIDDYRARAAEAREVAEFVDRRMRELQAELTRLGLGERSLQVFSGSRTFVSNDVSIVERLAAARIGFVEEGRKANGTEEVGTPGRAERRENFRSDGAARRLAADPVAGVQQGHAPAPAGEVPAAASGMRSPAQGARTRPGSAIDPTAAVTGAGTDERNGKVSDRTIRASDEGAGAPRRSPSGSLASRGEPGLDPAGLDGNPTDGGTTTRGTRGPAANTGGETRTTGGAGGSSTTTRGTGGPGGTGGDPAGTGRSDGGNPTPGGPAAGPAGGGSAGATGGNPAGGTGGLPAGSAAGPGPAGTAGPSAGGAGAGRTVAGAGTARGTPGGPAVGGSSGPTGQAAGEGSGPAPARPGTPVDRGPGRLAQSGNGGGGDRPFGPGRRSDPAGPAGVLPPGSQAQGAGGSGGTGAGGTAVVPAGPGRVGPASDALPGTTRAAPAKRDLVSNPARGPPPGAGTSRSAAPAPADAAVPHDTPALAPTEVREPGPTTSAVPNPLASAAAGSPATPAASAAGSRVAPTQPTAPGADARPAAEAPAPPAPSTTTRGELTSPSHDSAGTPSAYRGAAPQPWSPTAHSGPVAVGGLNRAELRAVLRLLPRLHDRLRPLRADELPLTARGPPVLVLPATALGLFADAGIPGVGDRLVAFGWRTGAAGGVVVLLEPVVAEVAGHIAAGRLPTDWVQRVLDHEAEYHLGTGVGPRTVDHDDHAAGLVQEFERARARQAAAPPAAPAPHHRLRGAPAQPSGQPTLAAPAGRARDGFAARVRAALPVEVHLGAAWARDLAWGAIAPVRAWAADTATGLRLAGAHRAEAGQTWLPERVEPRSGRVSRLTEHRLYAPIVPAAVAAAGTWLLGPEWAAVVLPALFMFPHVKLARTPGSNPGVWGYVKSIRWERAWMVAAALPLWQVPLLSWTVTGIVALELVGAGTLLAGFLSASMSRGLREESENRYKWPFTLMPDAKLWLRINVLGWQAGPIVYTFWMTPGEFRPVPGVPTPVVAGWTRWLQRLTYWIASYDKGVTSNQSTLYTFHFIGFAVGFGNQVILEQRLLIKEMARERAGRARTLDLFTGLDRQVLRLLYWLGRGTAGIAPGPLGRWLAGVPDRWADRAFRHLVEHAERMLVRNLTEQAWQRRRLDTARSERARNRLRAALAANVERAAEIEETLRRLPDEYEQRRQARGQARKDRLAAQLSKAVRDRARHPDRRRLVAREARLRAELDALTSPPAHPAAAVPLARTIGAATARGLERLLHLPAAWRLRSAVAAANRAATAAADAHVEAARRSVAANSAVHDLRERGIRSLFAGAPSTARAPQRFRQVALALLIHRREVAAIAQDPAIPTDAPELGGPGGSFQERLDRLVAAVDERLAARDAAVHAEQVAARDAAASAVQRQAALVQAVRAASARGLSPATIATATGLSRDDVDRLLGAGTSGTTGTGPGGTGGGSPPTAGSGRSENGRSDGPRAGPRNGARPRASRWWRWFGERGLIISTLRPTRGTALVLAVAGPLVVALAVVPPTSGAGRWIDGLVERFSAAGLPQAVAAVVGPVAGALAGVQVVRARGPPARLTGLSRFVVGALPAATASARAWWTAAVDGLSRAASRIGPRSWNRAWVGWSVRAVAVVFIVAALAALMAAPAGAVPVRAVAQGTAAGEGWLGAMAAVADGLLPAGPVVAGVLLVTRGLAWWRSRRMRSQVAMWAGIGRAGEVKTGKGVAGIDVLRLLAWAERVIENGRRVSGHGAPFGGFTADQLAGGASRMGLVATRDPQVLLGVAKRLSKRKHQQRVLEVLAELTSGPEPLVVQTVDADGAVRWRASELLMQLLARGPPEFAAALLADPLAVLRVEGLRRMSGAQLGGVVFDAVRRAVWSRTGAVAARGWRAWVPGVARGLFGRPVQLVAALFGRGQLTQLRRLVAPVRAARAAIAEHQKLRDSLLALQRLEAARRAAGAVTTARVLASARVVVAQLRLPRSLRFARDRAAERAALEQRLAGFDERAAQLQQGLTAALQAAWSRGARDGLAKKDVDRAAQNAAVGWWANKFALILGFYNALPSEAGKTYTAAEETIGRYYGYDATWATTVGGAVSWSSPLFGLVLALRGDRMIVTMAPTMIAAGVGLVGLALVGVGGGLVGFVVSGLMMSYWDAATGPLKARFDRAFPVAKELAAQREGQFQTGFKAGQMIPLQLMLLGYATLGVGPTSVIAAGVFAAFTAGVWWYLRGGGSAGEQKQPPNLRESTRKVTGLVRGTRHGVARLLFSMPVGTILTGLPVYALAGGMVGTAVQLSLLGGGATLWLLGAITVASGTSLLASMPRLGAVLAGLQWTTLHKALGGADNEAGVLVRLFAATGAVLVGMAVWGWLAPGFLPLGALMVVGAISTGWERTPIGVWIPGSAGKTVFNTSKGVAVALGIQLGGFTFGAAAAAAILAARTGADPATVDALVRDAFRVLLVLATGISGAKLVWALGVRTFRVAPVHALQDLLPAEHAGRIVEELKAAGYGDLGTLRAVFLDPARGSRTDLQKPLTRALSKADRKMVRNALRAYFGIPDPDAPTPPALPAPGPLGRAVRAVLGQLRHPASRARIVRWSGVVVTTAALLVLLAGSAAAATGPAAVPVDGAGAAPLLAVVAAAAGVGATLRWLAWASPARGPPVWAVRTAVVAALVAVFLLAGASPALASVPDAVVRAGDMAASAASAAASPAGMAGPALVTAMVAYRVLVAFGQPARNLPAMVAAGLRALGTRLITRLIQAQAFLAGLDALLAAASDSGSRALGVAARVAGRVVARAAVVLIAGTALMLGHAGWAAAGAGGAVPQMWVREGDTFDGIARALGVDPDALARANADRFPTQDSRDLIRPNESLNIPAEWDGFYRAQPGDSWWEINEQAFRLPGDWQDLAAANPGLPRGADGTHLGVETHVAIPGGRARPIQAPTQEPLQPPGQQPGPQPGVDPADSAPVDPSVGDPAAHAVWDVVAVWGVRALLVAAVVTAFIAVTASVVRPALRNRAYARQVAGWAAVAERSPESLQVLWQVMGGGVSVAEAASRWGVSQTRARELRDRAVALLTSGRAPLLVPAGTGPDGRQVWAPHPMLGRLMARAPPMAVRALLRDPAVTLQLTQQQLARTAPEQLTELVYRFLRGAVWQRDAVQAAPQPTISLDDLVQAVASASSTLRAADREHAADVRRRAAIVRVLAALRSGSVGATVWAWARAPRDLWAADQAELAAQLRQVRQRLQAHPQIRARLADEQARALRSALNAGAAGGYGQQTLERATRKVSMGVVARVIDTVRQALLERVPHGFGRVAAGIAALRQLTGRAVSQLALRGRLVGRGSARSPPSDVTELRAALHELRQRVRGRWLPQQREKHRELFGALLRILRELDAGPGEARRGELLAAALQTLTEFDRWVPSGRWARWRVQLEPSHRFGFGFGVAWALGAIATGYSSLAALLVGLPLNAGLVMPLVSAGLLVGSLVFGPLWAERSGRALALGFSTASAVAYALFAIVLGPAPALVLGVALILGIATSSFPSLTAYTKKWIEYTTEGRWANREAPRFHDSVIAFVGTLAGLLTWVALSLPALTSPTVSAWAMAGATAIGAVLLWFTMPPRLPSEEPAPSNTASSADGNPMKRAAATMKRSLTSVPGALRNKLVQFAALVFGFTAFVQNAFNALWREALIATGGASAELEVLFNGGVLIGNLVMMTVFFLRGDRPNRKARIQARETGSSFQPGSLLGAGAGAFLVGMAGLLAIGATAALVTAILPWAGAAVWGIGAAAFLFNLANAGVGLAVTGLAENRLGKAGAAALSAAVIVSALFGLVGAPAAALVSTFVGWPGVTVLMTTMAGLAVWAALKLLHQPVPTTPLEGRAGATTVAAARSSTAPASSVARLVRRAGSARFVVLGGSAVAGGVAAAAGALSLGAPGVAVPVAGVVAAIVAPAVAVAVRYVWKRGPPWARMLIRASVVVVVVAAILALGGSAAIAEPLLTSALE